MLNHRLQNGTIQSYADMEIVFVFLNLLASVNIVPELLGHLYAIATLSLNLIWIDQQLS